jgi:osmotically-inducible protein OsmY
MTDNDLQKAVQRELEWEPRVNAAQLGVAAVDGAVTLTGDIDSYSAKIAAIDAAERVYGVRAVADELAVTVPGTAKRDDSQIAQAASRALEWHTLVPKTVEAEVHDGSVRLKGRVQWQYERDEAADAVGRLIGVKGVVNDITIAPRARPEAIERRITDAFERNARLDARQITVTATNGTAHLYGSVHSIAEKRAARAAASSAPGVDHVDDQLTVYP